LRNLPALYAAADDSGRRLLNEAVFERIDVLGVNVITIHPTAEADAHGWSAAFGPDPLLVPVEIVANAKGTDGRGERDSPSLTHLSARPPFTVVNRTRTASGGPRSAVARSA
jgi:hypothetical protein